MRNRKWVGALLVAGFLLLALGHAPARAQQLKDLVIVGVYLDVKPQAANQWMVLFKKHLVPALNELREAGDVPDYHLLVPGIHNAGANYTHVLILVYTDRAAQGRAEKKLQEAFAAMGPAAAQFQGAIERKHHFDREFREVDLDSIEVPEEKEDEDEKQEDEEG
ncbi:MAG: hypothetical protein ACE5HB_05670 [Terriglobia bacterium]